jgi:hypothetical protein
MAKSMRKGSMYKIDSDTEVIIPAACVLYVGIDLIADESLPGSFLLQTQDHEVILHFLLNTMYVIRQIDQISKYRIVGD